MKQRIAIIGGGISGLTAAYVLHRDHAATSNVTLFEAGNRLGGIIETVCTHGFTIECGPDSWVTEKPWAEQLACELGLEQHLVRSNDHDRVTYIAQHGSLTPLPNAMRLMVPTDLDAVFASPLFSEEAKRAYAAEPSRAAELRESALLSRKTDADESVVDFVHRHFGEEVTATVARPLLAGVFGGDIDRLSARALLPTLVALEAQHGSLIHGLQQTSRASSSSVFTTLSGGLGRLVSALAERLPAKSLRLSTRVLAIAPHPAGWQVQTAQTRDDFDRVLIATPLDTTRRLLAELPLPDAQRAARVLPAHASSGLIVALGYPSRLGGIPRGFGFLVLDTATYTSSLLACTFLNQKFPAHAPKDATLLRAFFSNTAADQLSHLSDQQIATAAREQLIGFLGALPDTAEVTLIRRWPRSLPQYEVGHVARIAQFERSIAGLPGIAIVGNALHGVGLPDLIRDATHAAHTLAAG
ncbi:MAG TPA: protoporphyrinogen oxidase [Acidobacteriaceae bacterium]